MALFTVLLARGDSITVDGEFSIAERTGVLTVTRTKPPRTEITTHFSPAAWVSVETVVQQPVAVGGSV